MIFGGAVLLVLIAVPLASTPFPGLNKAVRSSAILGGINSVMPEQAQALSSALRDTLDTSGFPNVLGGLAPTNVLTRINYDTNLRNLLDHAGNRLCTQAQFEWRQVLSGVVQAIREHYIYDTRYIKMQDEWDPYSLSQDEEEYARRTESIRREYAAIASLLKPVCYQTGQCVFNADFDRKCSIRSRVDANHDINRPSSEWEFEYDKVDPTEVMTYNPELRTARDAHGTPKFIDAIRPEEWLLDPGAAR